MYSLKRLYLGTAQFGLDYGITNQSGKITTKEIEKIIELSMKSKIGGFDTAQAYGDAEKKLGRTLKSFHDFKLISKLSSQSGIKFGTEMINKWDNSFNMSLRNLKIKKIDTFLIHSSSDLLRSDSKYLLEWLESLRDRNLVNKIGVSIYDINELYKLPLEKLQIIQLPLSLYDQKFIRNGHIKYIKNYNIEIIARSIFLQGLILEKSNNLPKWLPKEFVNQHESLIEYAKSLNSTILQMAIHFALEIKEIDYILIGVTNSKQFKDVVSAFHTKNRKDIDYDQFYISDTNIIDPRRWEINQFK